MIVKKIVQIFVFLGILTRINSYDLSKRQYKNNNIDIHVSKCPANINCVLMLFEANDIWQVPGNYFHVNWYFDAVQTPNTHINGMNEIIFTYEPDYQGQTEFQVQNGIILEFNMYISLLNLQYEHLYNVILHELGHVYLLSHSEYKDSVMGYKLGLLNDKLISEPKLQLTVDDCLGLYNVLVQNKQHGDYKYARYLEQMQNSYCYTLPRNYIFEDPSKIVSSKIKNPTIMEVPTPHKLLPWQPMHTSSVRHGSIIPFFNQRRRFVPRISYRENNYDQNEEVKNEVLKTRGFNVHEYGFVRENPDKDKEKDKDSP